jgi:hypothetical protein
MAMSSMAEQRELRKVDLTAFTLAGSMSGRAAARQQIGDSYEPDADCATCIAAFSIADVDEGVIARMA